VQRRQFLGQFAEKDAERERVMTIFRRGRATLEETERQLDAITRETATLRALVDSLRAEQALLEAAEVQLTDTARMLGELREKAPAIEASDDTVMMRDLVELLVARITVQTEGEGRGKSASLNVTYRFSGTRTHRLDWAHNSLDYRVRWGIT
jgi:hypothetical protein